MRSTALSAYPRPITARPGAPAGPNCRQVLEPALSLLVLLTAAIGLGATPADRLQLHPKATPLPSDVLGPFVRLADGSVLAASPQDALFSKDEGRTWTKTRLFADPKKYTARGEAALLRTREGTIVMAFLNTPEAALHWNQKEGGPAADCRLPVYVVRSTDEGRTWLPPQKIQDGWCGAVRNMIQLRSGRLVLVSQVAVRDPGRHVSLTLVSDDQGATWRTSNIIDLGAYGGYGDHGGGIEGTVVQLRDHRLWLLLRTSRGRFSEAFSEDEGLTWKDIRPSKIAASGSPGMLARLHSGRLVLFWNRYIDPVKKTGRREQLSMAFSEDDGQTWTEPVVVGYDPMQPGDTEPMHRLSYPNLFEYEPGVMWVTTMQGKLRIRVNEGDFLPLAPRADKVYRLRCVPQAKIQLDGRLDEPDWQKANLESGFRFPWNKKQTPATEFRALCTADRLYFGYRVEDSDVVVVEPFVNEESAIGEDRVEMLLSKDERLSDYYAMEMDSRGRALDFRGHFYRKFDFSWNMPGLELRGQSTPQGYTVEGSIPLSTFPAIGLPELKPGTRIVFGLFRAEFSHGPDGKTIEDWISWVDPQTTEPDFELPQAFGYLEVVGADNILRDNVEEQ